MSIELPISSPVIIRWNNQMGRQESIFTNDPFASFEDEESKGPKLVIEEEDSDLEGEIDSTDESSRGQGSPNPGAMFSQQNFETICDFEKPKAKGLSSAINDGTLKVDKYDKINSKRIKKSKK